MIQRYDVCIRLLRVTPYYPGANDVNGSGNDEANVVDKTPVPKKVQVGKDQEKAQSEKDSHSKNRGGKKPN